MKDSQTTELWTDYPIIQLGDSGGKEAPVRKLNMIEYDGDKYALVEVCGLATEIKIGYIYHKKGRCGEVPRLTHKEAMKYARI